MNTFGRNGRIILKLIILVIVFLTFVMTIPVFMASKMDMAHSPDVTPSVGMIRPSSVDEAIRSMNWGLTAFNVPTAVPYDENFQAELLLSSSTSNQVLQSNLVTRIRSHGSNSFSQASSIRISSLMEAKLTGRGFAIEAVTPERQAVSTRRPTNWLWDVKPTERGSQTLHLALSAVIEIDGREAPLVVQTFQKDIQVQVTVPQIVATFVGNNWKWLWTTLLVPAAVGLWRYLKPNELPKG